MYSWFSNLSQISLKNSYLKMVIQFFAKIEMTQNENRFFAAFLKRYKFFILEIWLWLVCI